MIPDDLLDPVAWPEPRPTRVELVETHVSWVLRGDREVFKVKKPVSLGFLDFGTVERRRAACEEEVRLNAALAPGVYLGVSPIVARTEDRVVIGAAGEAPGRSPVVDWAVRMRRLDDAQRADARLAAGALEAGDVHRIAELVAAFHAGRAVDHHVAAQWASHSAVARNVHENFAQTRARVHAYVDPEVAAEAEARQTAFLRDRADLFAARVAAGRIRDGHGDLRLEHVYLEPDGIRVIDCIEFAARYRIGDGCADVAFLAMDLEAHGRADLAERLLARYARAADDHDLYALVDFYAGYRAWVRGKVAMLLAEDAGASEATRERAAREARRHLLLAVAAARPPLVAPTLVCVAGLIASGKSTVADAVAASSPARSSTPIGRASTCSGWARRSRSTTPPGAARTTRRSPRRSTPRCSAARRSFSLRGGPSWSTRRSARATCARARASSPAPTACASASSSAARRRRRAASASRAARGPPCRPTGASRSSTTSQRASSR